jgi:uroporphyrinogen-III synthase
MPLAPLAGYTIGVTADRRADEQIRLLSGRGAECVHGPVIKTHPLGSHEKLRRATVSVIRDPPRMMVLTTGIGVRSWLEAADASHLGDQLRSTLARCELVARGPKAVGALVTAGLEVAWNAPNARYDDIIAMLAERDPRGLRVGVQLDGADAPELCDQIAALGAEVVRIPVYRWSRPHDRGPAERLVRATCEGRIDALTFTARPAVENFLAIVEQMGLAAELAGVLAERTVCFCVGPVCATGFDGTGLPDPVVPERTRLGAMVQLVTAHLSGRAQDLSLAGVPVRVQGRAVAVGGSSSQSLTDRERSVLAVLIERPGVVHSKRALLSRVWGPGESDEHVVEVTIGRLRNRLGRAGAGIETVIRRGYRASPT